MDHWEIVTFLPRALAKYPANGPPELRRAVFYSKVTWVDAATMLM